MFKINKALMAGLFVVLLSGLLPLSSYSQTATEVQSELERQLAELQSQIDKYESELATTQKEKNTLAARVKTLNLQRSKLKLQIEQTQKNINDTESRIEKTETSMSALEKREKSLLSQIAALLREANQQNTNTLVLIASRDSISEVFREIFSMDSVTQSLGVLVPEVRATRIELSKLKENYEEEKDAAVKLLSLKSVQQLEVAGSIKEQNNLLAETKGKELNYQAALADTKKRANQIRNRLYELFQSGKEITFGQAVAIAQSVGKSTGVRPAFLLAILTQESNLGKNVGTCNRTGDPPEKSWRVIMKPSRDHEPYLKITEELGMNPDTTPLSCPMKDKKGNQIGWGGAMGPAQFIPSTWMGYRTKIMAVTGKSTANPWDIRDAFVASAIKLKNDGADGTEKGEWNAAMRYFSGSTNSKYRFYADSVLNIAKQYEEDIKDINL